MQVSWKACLITLVSFSVLSLQVNAGQNCSNKTTVNSGETAMLYYPTSHRLRENSTDFEWYRAYKENISFAFMNNSITGSCEEDSALNTFCKKKVTFEVKNQTHLLLQIKDTTVNDSGCYAVHYKFGSFSSNDKKERKLEVITLEVKGSSTGNPVSTTSTTTGTLSSTSGAMLHSLPVGLFVFHLLIVGINEYTG